MIRIGVDSGGTFTDILLLDSRGMRVHKVRSTPDDPSRAILKGIAELAGDAALGEVVHGSTVATNALLERKGARVALITTKGFEDVLLIGRQTRAALYDFQVKARRPLIAEGMTFGVGERLAADGSVVEAMRAEEVEEIVAKLRGLPVDSVALCLLHSYANPLHELRLEEALTEAGFMVSVSHKVLPEYREFERWSTTAVNAYVTPMMANYLSRLEVALGGRALRVMQSNGGSLSASGAKSAAVQTVLSGPAAGLVGAKAIASASGYDRIIAFDMGGTSTDVSLVDGAIGTTMESMVGDFPVRLPMLDIHTVGAGGGSIVWVDAGGGLRVGPQSAGAEPGPACYGTGEKLTVTDANLLLGRLDPEYFLGGRMTLDVSRARRIAKELAGELGISEVALLEGVVRIANANMVRAIRLVSVERGFDPRDFALLAFGGAGGLHACEMAEMLDISTVLIPQHAGVLSALGMLLADATKDYSTTVLKETAEITQEELRARFAPMVEVGLAELGEEGFARRSCRVECSVEMRYRGQGYEIAVPLRTDFEEEFHRMHHKLYGYASATRATEIVHLRVKAIGITEKPSLPRAEVAEMPLSKPIAMRSARFRGRIVKTAVYHRDELAAGMYGAGPAIVASGESTTIVPPGHDFRVDAVGTLIATRSALAQRRVRVAEKVKHAD